MPNPETSPTSEDMRSVLVLVEPRWEEGRHSWHGMAFVAGKQHNDIIGTNRAVVLDDCLSAVAANGVDFDFDPESDPLGPECRAHFSSTQGNDRNEVK